MYVHLFRSLTSSIADAGYESEENESIANPM